MANVKISALPSATTPLAGTEVIPLVQGGVTKKVAASAIATSAGGGSSVSVTLSAAQIASLNSVPFQLLAAQSGKALFPGQMVWVFTPDTGGGVFTGATRTFSVYLDSVHPLIVQNADNDSPTFLASMVLEATRQTGFVTVLSAAQAADTWWGPDASFVNVPLMLKASNSFTYNGLPVTTSIATPGSGYYAGQQLYDENGNATFTADTVSAIGAILTYTRTSPGTTLYNPMDTFNLYSNVGLLSVTAVVTIAKTFTVAGNQVAKFPVGGVFYLDGSTGNNGTYTTVSAVFGAGVTVVTVVEVIPDATADGQIHPGSDSAVLTVDTIANDATLAITTSYQAVTV